MAEAQEVVRIGVIGTGFGSRVQIPGFLKLAGVEVIGIMSSGRFASAQKVAADFKIAQACQNFEEMLALPDLDAISIVTPPYQHFELTMRALQAGKHVLCEKPMALEAEQARKMVEAGRRMGLVGMIDHEFRYVPARAYVKELIEAGWLGQLINANIAMLTGTAADPRGRAWSWLFDAEAGGGFLGALGSHYIDALTYWFGNISAVSATINTFVKERHLNGSEETRSVSADDSFTLLCRFARGGQGLINVSAVTRFGGGERMELYGSSGTLVIDNEGRLYGAKAGEDQLRQLTIPAHYSEGLSASDPRLRPFVMLANDFVNAIRQVRSGQSKAVEIAPSFADGLKVQQVIDAARQSAEASGWVSLPPR